MALAVNSNQSSLMAKNSLRVQNLQLSSASMRLATGLRINSAKDDAAGLAISNRMNIKIHSLAVAIRNASNGISLLQTAEGGLSSISENLQRIRELAVQSSNSVHQQADRKFLNSEANQLISEIDRIADNTTFNGIKLLDGSFKDKTFQIGANNTANDSLTVSIPSAHITQNATKTSALNSFETKTITEEVTRTTYSAQASGSVVSSSALNSGDLSINGVPIAASSSGSAKDIAAAINQKTSLSGVKATAQPTTSSSVGILEPTTPTISGASGTVSISVSPVSVSEVGSNNLLYSFTRSGDTSQELTVNVNLGGTANSADYISNLTYTPASAPTKEWAKIFSNNTDRQNYINTNGLASNSNENTGIYNSKIFTLDGSSYKLERRPGGANVGDTSVTKFNTDGTESWTRWFGTSDPDFAMAWGGVIDASSIAYASATGTDGSLYIAGATTGSIDGQPFVGPDDVYVTNDPFLIKYNPDGSKAWTRMWGSAAHSEYAQQLVIGNDGSIYVSGPVAGAEPTDRTINLDGQSGIDGDLFLTKFSSNGTKEWTRVWGGIPYNNNFMFANLADGMTTTLDGSILVVGSTTGDFDGEKNNSDYFLNDIFITQFNPNGNKDWTRLIGTKQHEQAQGIFTNVDGSIYVKGVGRNPFNLSDPDYGNLYEEKNFIGEFDSFRNPLSPNIWLYSLLKFNVGSHTVRFSAGSSTTTLAIDPTSDALSEGSETLTLTLLQGSGYSIGTASATGTIVDGSAFTFNSIASGDIQLNGVNIGAIATASSSSQRAAQMLNAINAKTSNTGVVASLDTVTGGINLSAADGRNIVISTLASSAITGDQIGIALNGVTSGSRSLTTYSSSIDLTSTSSSGITIVANANGANASGFTTGATAPTSTTTTETVTTQVQVPSTKTEVENSPEKLFLINLSTAENSQASLTFIDLAIDAINQSRASLGGYQSRFSSAVEVTESEITNLSSSSSRIVDADYAIETTNLAKFQIMSHAATSMLAQANIPSQSVLTLLRDFQVR